MLNAVLVQIIEEAGASVLILSEGLTREELLHSRLTRHEISHQVQVMMANVARLPIAAHSAMPELDGEGWQRTGQWLEYPCAEQDEALWFAVQSLVPATLLWLRVYRQNQPELFQFTPELP